MRRNLTIKDLVIAAAAGVVFIGVLAAAYWFAWPASYAEPYRFVSTVAGLGKEFGEPFGIAVGKGSVYISDGQNDKIFRIDGATTALFAEGFDTPSGIALTPGGELIVADTGSNTIKSVNATGEVTVIAGSPGVRGFADGDAAVSLFNGPVGVAAGVDGKIFVTDTYNDRIRVIENGKVSTLAGGTKGLANGTAEDAKFDTPTGIAIWRDSILIADTGNRLIRVVEPDGRIWTLAGGGEGELKDGLLLRSSFVEPTGIAIDPRGTIFVADGNAIRRIGGPVISTVTTISAHGRGLRDSTPHRSQFNRPSGLAIAPKGDLIVGDSENRLVRRFSSAADGIPVSAEQLATFRDNPQEFRAASGRWPFDPPTAKRDIAGTLGEIRGEMTPSARNVWFHNGLDIAGAYGETARFIREEKVLRPVAAENFGTLRELLRMPTLGYIHIRLGRDQASRPFDDERFQFQRDAAGKLTGVRIPRGARFNPGEPIGTLNAMNHVHLIAGRSGSEMNALDALDLPGIADSRPPVIEKVELYDQNWSLVETVTPNSRIKLTERTRIVVRAYDQVDGNSERRRLGVYKLGYQVLANENDSAADEVWTIRFDRMPPNDAVRYAYADGSHSGATGETIFRYIVSNFVDGDEYREDLLDPSGLANGNYVLRVFAADYFGNTSSKDIEFEVLK
ncbi:MAG: hypothetical protein AB7J13_04290 [Pyrinomonadaceae bacterium]